MTDHKASVKIEFSIYGETYKMNSWINWSVGGECDPVDDRVIEFFRQNYYDAHGKYVEENEKADRERQERELEAQERAQLARLKAKYDK